MTNKIIENLHTANAIAADMATALTHTFNSVSLDLYTRMNFFG